MTDEEIVRALHEGHTLFYGVNGRNTEVMNFIEKLEASGIVSTWDASLSQETRRGVRMKDHADITCNLMIDKTVEWIKES